MAEARVVRVIIKIDEWYQASASYVYTIGALHEKYGIYQGVYTIGGNVNNPYYTISTGTGAADVYGAYADVATFKSSVDTSSWTASVWTTGAGSVVK